jgi:Anaphase-promoting complex subunit 5
MPCGPLAFPKRRAQTISRAVALAREIGHASALMHALSHMVIPQTLCGNQVAAGAQAQEQVTLAEEKGSQFWKAFGMMNQGSVLSLIGRASDAIEILTASSVAWRATRSTLWLPFFLPRLARAHAELGHFEQAWRSIGEATNLVEATKEKWGEAVDTVVLVMAWLS